MILVTGGAGFIGSHTCVELLNDGYEVAVIDNLVNSKPETIEKIKQITGKDVKFYEADLLDRQKVEEIFENNSIEAVIHFAGLKAVGESVEKPMEYYYNNIGSTLVLTQTMAKYGCKKIVFSSSATVYGDPLSVPITEDFPLHTTNPYGSTKLMIENILTDIHTSDNSWSVVLLRYFNPVGAHKSGLIGESPNGIPNNLVPYIAQVATGEREHLNVFGNDYNTPDGTGVRDYIHVVDLSTGHVKALEKIKNESGVFVYNLGTGNGYSVLEMLHAYEKACKKEIKYVIAPRRPGDIAMCYADTSKSKKELGWEATRGIDEMCEDSWRFICNTNK